MNKNEKSLMLGHYKNEFELLNDGYDYKEKAIKSLRILFRSLGLIKDIVRIENEVKIEEWCFLSKDSFMMLFDSLNEVGFLMDMDSFENETVDDFIEYEIEDQDSKKSKKACLRNIRNWNNENKI